MLRSIKVAVLTLVVSTTAIAGAQRIQVRVDGEAINFPYAQPQYVNGRVLVPLRGVFERLGANVNWSPATRMVSAYKDGTNVQLRIGDSRASVNGSTVNLDVPPMILNGTTMVPIRFVSESLGAQVGWMDAEKLVTIETSTSQNQTIQTPPRNLRSVVFRANEVIPVTLDEMLSTSTNAKGDEFTATVRTRDLNSYANIPRGTQVVGHIAAIHPRSGDRPAILDLMFDRLRFPSGRSVPIDGLLTSTDSNYVTRDENGRLVARNSNSGQDQRMVYAGYGAGAGLLVGVLTRRPLEDTILGGALGYIFGQVQHDQRMTSDITLNPGTEMGVKLDRDATISW